MTLSELTARLATYPADAPLVFSTGDGDIGAGYHLTEFRLSDAALIDCGARISREESATLQLLDGHGREYMSVGKFRAIAETSQTSLPRLGKAPLAVEFGHGNRALSLYDPEEPEAGAGRVVLRLTPKHAVCRPDSERSAGRQAAGACCG